MNRDLIRAGVPFVDIYRQSDITIEELVSEFTEVIREDKESRQRDIQAIEREAHDARGVIGENQLPPRTSETGDNMAEVGEPDRDGSERRADSILSHELGKVPQKDRKRRDRRTAIPIKRVESKGLLPGVGF